MICPICQNALKDMSFGCYTFYSCNNFENSLIKLYICEIELYSEISFHYREEYKDQKLLSVNFMLNNKLVAINYGIFSTVKVTPISMKDNIMQADTSETKIIDQYFKPDFSNLNKLDNKINTLFNFS